MHEIKLDPLPVVTGDPDELLDLDICDTCEFATTQAARIAAICEQVKRDTAAGVADEIPYNYTAADAVA